MERGRQERSNTWKYRQHLAAFLSNLSVFCSGVIMGWSAPALPLLEHTVNSTLPIYLAPHEAPWMVGLLPIGALVGAIPAGYLANSIGRRAALLWTTAPFIVGWALILAAQFEVTLMFVGRFIGGISMGASTLLVPIYCEEIAEVSIRGALGAYVDALLCIGCLWAYVFGAVLDYMWFTLISAVSPLIFVATFFWMPESPTFLVSKGRTAEAEKSLTWLRNGGDRHDIGPELHSLMTSLNAVSQEKTGRSFTETLKSFTFTSNTAKAIRIIFFLNLLKQFTGSNLVTYYTVQVFNDAGSDLSGDVSAIIMMGIETVGSIVAMVTVDLWGRRPLLITSTLLMALCHGTLSVYFYCEDNYDIESWRWIPLVSFSIFVLAFSLGIGPITWFMMAELLPTEDKAWGSALLTNGNWSVVAIFVLVSPYVVHVYDQCITYGALGVICFLEAVLIALFVPETKNKSREEIQHDLKTRTCWLVTKKKKIIIKTDSVFLRSVFDPNVVN